MLRYSLRQLEYFVAAARHRSIAAAARELNVSQPSISKSIAKFEQQFSIQLFIRHHARGMSLTPVGKRLLTEAMELLRYAQDLQQNAQEATTSITGKLEIACFASVAPVFMPAILAKFSELYPGIDVHMREGNQTEIYDDLANGRIELAITYLSPLAPRLIAQTLAEFETYVLLPAQHRFARQDSVSLKSLEDENFILLEAPPSREFFMKIFTQIGIKPKISVSSPSLEMVRGLVGRNRGYSIMVTQPRCDQTYDGREIVGRPIREKTEKGILVMLRHESIHQTRIVTAFSDYCEQWFAGLETGPEKPQKVFHHVQEPIRGSKSLNNSA